MNAAWLRRRLGTPRPQQRPLQGWRNARRSPPMTVGSARSGGPWPHVSTLVAGPRSEQILTNDDGLGMLEALHPRALRRVDVVAHRVQLGGRGRGRGAAPGDAAACAACRPARCAAGGRVWVQRRQQSMEPGRRSRGLGARRARPLAAWGATAWGATGSGYRLAPLTCTAGPSSTRSPMRMGPQSSITQLKLQ